MFAIDHACTADSTGAYTLPLSRLAFADHFVTFSPADYLDLLTEGACYWAVGR